MSGSGRADGSIIQKADEDKLAMLFAKRYAGIFFFCAQIGYWFFWTGQYWVRDETLVAREYIRQLARTHNIRETVSMSKSSFVTGIERHAKGDRLFAVQGSELDRDHYLLNTPDGTYNLVTGERQEHNPLDRITKISPVAPSKLGGYVFEKFLDEITLGDKQLQIFLQCLLGSILSGAREEHWIAFWIGEGRNGKSTLAEVIVYVLGGYAKKVPASLLLSQKFESHPTEFANLQGLRMALSSEIPEGSYMNEARIKELTGDAIISARFMRQDLFEFPRTHKHIVLGNNRPQLRTIDPAMKSRLKIVPFKACFAEREDHEMPDKLMGDAGYILYWLMEGHRMWLEAGRNIGSCAAVDAELEDYFASQSTPDMWVRECCLVVPDEGQPKSSWPTSTALYERYKSWKQARGETPLTQTSWAEHMKANFESVISNGVRYRGIKLMG